MTKPVVAVIAPGMMGAAVGWRLSQGGAEVVTDLSGRSRSSAERAETSGMRGVALADIGKANIILSIVPPSEALGLAQRLAPVLTSAAAKPLYIDCNAVSTATVQSIAAVIAPTGAPFADGGIIGGPPRDGYDGPSVYVSGTSAASIAPLIAAGLKIKLSGFANATLGSADTPRGGLASAAEAEIEVTPQYKLPSGTVLAVRATLGVGEAGPTRDAPWRAAVPEVSAFAIGSFGRVEIGVRAGFPQSLIGFTPSEIAFTAAEFGPESGARLDPDGRLPTALLPPTLGARIDRLTYLGYATRFYDDRSFKAIYLTPRFKGGVYAAVSYAPRTDRPGGFGLAGSPVAADAGFRDLVQAALVWNHRSEAVDLSIGGTFSHAAPSDDFTPGARRAASNSLSGGLSATIRDRWALGLSGTWDGLSPRRPGDTGRAPYGVVASVNFVEGPWVAGGYYQHASARVDAALPEHDRLDIGEIGVSYLIDKNHDRLGDNRHTDVKLFTSLYAFGLSRSPQGLTSTRQSGWVGVAGARFSFF